MRSQLNCTWTPQCMNMDAGLSLQVEPWVAVFVKSLVNGWMHTCDTKQFKWKMARKAPHNTITPSCVTYSTNYIGLNVAGRMRFSSLTQYVQQNEPFHNSSQKYT